MNIQSKFFKYIWYFKQILMRIVIGNPMNDFIRRDKAAWEQAGHLHPKRENSMRGMMIFLTHCIEKGMTMPRFELGHSTGSILKLCETMSKYKKFGYDQNAFEYRTALSVITEYRLIHLEQGFSLPPYISQAMSDILAGEDVTPKKQLEMTPQMLWQHTDEPFPIFSASRHSVRSFAGPIPHKKIMDSINLATNAPSACNKQYVRIHLYEGKEKVQPLLNLQNGNAGFGDRVEQMLIITSDMSYMHWHGERHEIYLCAGLFAMNLSYAMHYHHIAHCMLNWQVTPKIDKEMRARAGIPDYEEIALIIIFGQPTTSFKATASSRRQGDDICFIH